MANYYRHLIKYWGSGSVLGTGVLVFYYNLVHNEKNRVYAAQTHGIAVHKWDVNWDRRNPASIAVDKGFAEGDKEYQSEVEKNIPKSTRHIFLIRHGQYNLDGTTDKERFLTPLGREQAEFAGNRLKQLNYPYSALYKSTMSRAQETAEIILGCLQDVGIKEIKDCNMLEEGAPIAPEPPVGHWKPEAHFRLESLETDTCSLSSKRPNQASNNDQSSFSSAGQQCVSNFHRCFPESALIRISIYLGLLQQFYQDGPRIEAAFRKYIHRADVRQAEDSYEIIVCHSNVIRYFICRALQFPPDAWLRFTLHHCSITWLVITPSGRVIVRALGDSGHIPPEAITNPLIGL